jgi:redox-sensitive bicupin YhaK (pirin superfamily)
MSIQFSPVVTSKAVGKKNSFSVQSIDMKELSPFASPVLVLDEFRVRGRPFPAHPHAGFSAISCVLEDSQGSLRSRDSLGNDIVTGPGGIVWLQAGRGAIHEEFSVEPDRELHGVQVFVNLSSRSKLVQPRVFQVEKGDIPEWRSATGGLVRVLAGAFEGRAARFSPAEPFTLLDIQLRHEISFPLAANHNAVVYVLEGETHVRAQDEGRKITAGQAIALHAARAGLVSFETHDAARLLVLSGARLDEPIVEQGSFIMNDTAQIDAALARYRAGEMGSLSPA